MTVWLGGFAVIGVEDEEKRREDTDLWRACSGVRP